MFVNALVATFCGLTFSVISDIDERKKNSCYCYYRDIFGGIFVVSLCMKEGSLEENFRRGLGRFSFKQAWQCFRCMAKHVNFSNHQCGQEELSNDQHPFSTDSDKPTNRQSKNVLNHKIDHQINEFTDKETHNTTDYMITKNIVDFSLNGWFKV